MISRKEKPSSRLRVLQYLPYLRKQGFSCRVIEVRKNFFQRIIFLFLAFFNDCLFIQKKILSRAEIFFLRMTRARIIFDLDDAIIYKERGEKAEKNIRAEKKLQTLLKTADLVIAGNTFLSEIAGRYHPRIRIIPTPWNPSPTETKAGKSEKGKALVWIGSKSTMKYLQNLENVFRRLTDKYPDIRLIVISNAFPGIKNISTENIIWKEENEADLIRRGDIGLMPLPDNEWCRGKCGFKIIQYMACGLPPVASPVGMNADLIQDGRNGFLPRNEEEWLNKISLLLENADLYKQMSQKAKETFEKEYQVGYNAGKLIAVIEELLKDQNKKIS